LKEYTFLKRPVFIIGNELFAGNARVAIDGVKEALAK
jgi:arsenate reductase